MNEFEHKLKPIIFHNRDGSFSTQSNRKRVLVMFSKDLHDLQYKVTSPYNLKPKRITESIKYWKAKKLSPGTMKNRMSHIRWLLAKVNKSSIIPRTNAELGIPNRITEKKTKR